MVWVGLYFIGNKGPDGGEMTRDETDERPVREEQSNKICERHTMLSFCSNLKTSSIVGLRCKRPRIESFATYDSLRQQICQLLDSAGSTVASVKTESDVSLWEHVLSEVYRVLRNCWLFCGRPQDIFEPAHHLHKVSRQLLTTYAGYGVTHDGQYLFLQGEQHMPQAGLLIVVVQRLLSEHSCRDMLPAATLWPHCSHSFWCNSTIRVVTLSCRCFGWPSGSSNECGFDCDDNWRLKIEVTLREVFGAEKDITVVLLGGCQLTESGARLLASNFNARCFASSDWHSCGLGCCGGVASIVFGAESRMTMQTLSTEGSFQLDSSFCHAVTCGSYTGRGVRAHSFLLSPMGPLIIHIQQCGRRYTMGSASVDNKGCCCDDGCLISAKGGCDIDSEKADFWDWLYPLTNASQPTVILQLSNRSVPVTDNFFLRLTGFTDVTSDEGRGVQGHHSRRLRLNNRNNRETLSGCVGGLLMAYACNAIMTLEQDVEQFSGSCACNIWRLYISPPA